MLTIVYLLALGAFLSAILSLMNKCPLAVPVLLLSIAELLQCVPLK